MMPHELTLELDQSHMEIIDLSGDLRLQIDIDPYSFV